MGQYGFEETAPNKQSLARSTNMILWSPTPKLKGQKLQADTEISAEVQIPSICFEPLMRVPGGVSEVIEVIESTKARPLNERAILPIYMFSFASKATTIENLSLIEAEVKLHKSSQKAFLEQISLPACRKNLRY